MRYVRLKKNTDFQKLFKRGKRVFSPCITLLYAPADRQIMGIALSKKHGKAVKRNRIKRLIRAAYDKNVNMLNENYSVVVMPKVQEDYSFAEIERSLIICFKRLNSQCRN
ncbi:MAG: ribonuclease P protein component [Candidatus Coproplasma sp.]